MSIDAAPPRLWWAARTMPGMTWHIACAIIFLQANQAAATAMAFHEFP
jgi:hypothetical protein